MTEHNMTYQHYKILITINLLSKMHDYPSSQGVYKILKGIQDIESMKYANFPTFATFISVSYRRVTSMCKNLYSLELIKRIFNPEENVIYYCITPEGEKLANKFVAEHGYPFKKNKLNVKKSYIHID